MAGSVLTPYRNIQKKSWQSPICRCQDPTQDAFSSWWTARQVIPKLQPSLLGPADTKAQVFTLANVPECTGGAHVLSACQKRQVQHPIAQTEPLLMVGPLLRSPGKGLKSNT